MSAAAACENRRKRALLTDEDSVPSCSTGAVDFEPRCAKRACPNPPCSINYCTHPQQGANYCMHPRQDACSSQAKHDGEDSACDEPEKMGELRLDADERAIREMMCSLEQAIRNDEQYTEDASSCSSPLTSSSCATTASARAGGVEERQLVSESECRLKFLGDGNASIDEEIQQLLQQAEDQNFLANFCENWDNCASASSDYLNMGNLPVYPYDDELGVVYNPLLDPNSECSFDCL